MPFFFSPPNLAPLSASVCEVSRGRALHLDTLLFLCSCRGSVHLPQGANYRAEIKHDQLFMQEFHPPGTEECKKSRY